MEGGGLLEGRVVLVDGLGSVGGGGEAGRAEVGAFEVWVVDGRGTWRSWGFGAGERGRFGIEGAPEGPVVVFAAVEGLGFSRRVGVGLPGAGAVELGIERGERGVGRVVDAETGEALVGARIDWLVGALDWPHARCSTGVGSDGGGRFEVRGLTAEVDTVVVWAPGYRECEVRAQPAAERAGWEVLGQELEGSGSQVERSQPEQYRSGQLAPQPRRPERSQSESSQSLALQAEGQEAEAARAGALQADALQSGAPQGGGAGSGALDAGSRYQGAAELHFGLVRLRRVGTIGVRLEGAQDPQEFRLGAGFSVGAGGQAFDGGGRLELRAEREWRFVTLRWPQGWEDTYFVEPGEDGLLLEIEEGRSLEVAASAALPGGGPQAVAVLLKWIDRRGRSVRRAVSLDLSAGQVPLRLPGIHADRVDVEWSRGAGRSLASFELGDGPVTRIELPLDSGRGEGGGSAYGGAIGGGNAGGDAGSSADGNAAGNAAASAGGDAGSSAAGSGVGSESGSSAGGVGGPGGVIGGWTVGVVDGAGRPLARIEAVLHQRIEGQTRRGFDAGPSDAEGRLRLPRPLSGQAFVSLLDGRGGVLPELPLRESDFGLEAPVLVFEPQGRAEFEFRLEGRPLADVTTRWECAGGNLLLLPRWSDAAGRVARGRLGPGSYLIWIEHPQIWPLRCEFVLAEQHSARIELVRAAPLDLDVAARLPGLDPGIPLELERLDALEGASLASWPPAELRLDPDGHLRLPRAPTGRLRLRAGERGFEFEHR